MENDLDPFQVMHVGVEMKIIHVHKNLLGYWCLYDAVTLDIDGCEVVCGSCYSSCVS